jgi:hypothetical protein
MDEATPKELFQSFFAGNSQFLTAFCSATGEHLSSVGSCHTLAKAVYAFATTLMWLESSFHWFVFSAPKIGFISLLQSPYCCL